MYGGVGLYGWGGWGWCNGVFGGGKVDLGLNSLKDGETEPPHGPIHSSVALLTFGLPVKQIAR